MTAGWRIVLVCWLLLVPGFAPAEVAVPALHAHVTDLSATLDAQQIGELESMLRDFEARKGSQIALLIVPTTQPETIEEYGIRVAEQWKLGRKGVDDGALLLVAKQDRAMRIEVGYGLEGVLPDVVAKRIVSETITPLLKQGDFYGGIRGGLSAMIKVVNGEPLPSPSPRKNTVRGGGSDSFLYILFFMIATASLLRSLFGLFGSLIAGSVAGVLAWLSFGSLLAGLLAALLTIVFSFGRGVGGFIPGGGGGGGGGGFSGGGGGFGGGGASGRW